VAFPALIPVEKTHPYALFISSLPPSNCGIAVCLMPLILWFVRGLHDPKKRGKNHWWKNSGKDTVSR
jgi:hypothetical protein